MTPAVLSAFLAAAPGGTHAATIIFSGWCGACSTGWSTRRFCGLAGAAAVAARDHATHSVPFDLPRARRLIEAAAALPDANKAPQRGLTMRPSSRCFTGSVCGLAKSRGSPERTSI